MKRLILTMILVAFTSSILEAEEGAKVVAGVVSSGSLPISEPKVLWTITPDYGTDARKRVSTPVVADGFLYFAMESGRVSSIRISDQSVVWTHTCGARMLDPPAIDDELAYLVSANGIRAIQRTDGKQIWDFNIPQGAQQASPVSFGEHLYVSACNGQSYCFERKSGRQVWSHDFVADRPPAQNSRLQARPSGGTCDGELFIQSVFDQHRAIAIDCRTGTRKWTFQTQGLMGAPVVANGRVFVSSQDRHLYCVDWNSGELIWKYEAPMAFGGRVIAHEGYVYVPYRDASMLKLDVGTGELVHKFEPPAAEDRVGNASASSILSNNTVYYSTEKGLLMAFDIESGDMRWKLRPVENADLQGAVRTDGKTIFLSTRGRDNDASIILAIGE